MRTWLAGGNVSQGGHNEHNGQGGSSYISDAGIDPKYEAGNQHCFVTTVKLANFTCISFHYFRYGGKSNP